MKNTILASLLALSLAWSAAAATTRNDDSCDVAVMPAATLLLPYFEVDLDDPNAETTLVTITNVSNLDAVARVTLWTDRGYPVFSFNVYLTGYDVQPLNLYDILGRGLVAPDEGTGTAVSRREHFSDPNPALDLANCAQLPAALTATDLARIQSAFTTGVIPGECDEAGGVHDNATGYATIDVVGNCSTNTPRERAYWNSDLRYDNVLLGDYEQLDSVENYAQGGPLVHIRAIPEGGTPRSRRPSEEFGFPRTFYARYTDRDGRQPLPAQFAARWTSGTSLKIWREGRAGVNASCDDYAADENLAVADVVVFDDQENGSSAEGRVELPATTKAGVADSRFPQLANGASSGWMYLNLDRSGRDAVASQAWVVASTRTEGRYSSDVDAVALGNGCSAPAEEGQQIAPAPDETNDDSCDIALLPAATLLVPYFEVDLDEPDGETTIFTVTNVSPQDRIARVTLWTDYAYPVISFNIYLTGYDVQSINLFDVIQRGIIAPDAGTGTQVTERGPFSDRNFELDLSECGQLVDHLPQAYVQLMQQAFTEGTVPAIGSRPACMNVGNEHDRAIGYATIDVVRNCEENGPSSEEYWTEDLAWDNVLIGDYHQVDASEDFAQGSTAVHIRAIPEGGTSAERLAVQRRFDAGFPRTFYSSFQPPNTPKLDGRQPLPSVVAARWIRGGPGDFRTNLKIWREAKRGRTAECSHQDDNVVSWRETVRFDEQENAVADVPWRAPSPVPEILWLPATSSIAIEDSSYIPQLTNGALGGWIYLNLDDEEDGRSLQSWVVSSMRADGRYSVDVDAAALGNGCSAEAPMSETTIGTEVIGPRP
jgi:hypothetical protein